MPLNFKMSIITLGVLMIAFCIAVIYLFWRDIDQALDPWHDEPYGDWPPPQRRGDDEK